MRSFQWLVHAGKRVALFQYNQQHKKNRAFANSKGAALFEIALGGPTLVLSELAPP
jgi:hypothetical protein